MNCAAPPEHVGRMAKTREGIGVKMCGSNTTSSHGGRRSCGQVCGRFSPLLIASLLCLRTGVLSYAQGTPGPDVSGPTQQQLNMAGSDTHSWLYATHDYASRKFVNLNQINTQNVNSLRPVCIYQAPEGSTAQTNPIVYNNLIYITTQHLTVALDATNCGVRWISKWKPIKTEAFPQSRGVAIKDGLVLRGTADGYLIALDAANGAARWQQSIADPAKGYSFTMPPLVYHDLVIVGTAGGELGIKGWIGAFRLKDGASVWKFNTIPDHDDPAAKTWGTAPSAGGAIWSPLALDLRRELVFVPVGNPIPSIYDNDRPGHNLYTDTVLALHVRTGKLAWYYQPNAHDQRDWDLTQVGPIFQVDKNGHPQDLIAVSGKDGLLRAIDLDTQQVIYETPITSRENVDTHITQAGVHTCPGFLGGQEWNGSSYDPRNQLLIAQAGDWCNMVYSATAAPVVDPKKPNNKESQSVFVAGKVVFDPWDKARGWLTAVDARTGKVCWKYRSAKPMHAAVVTTAGDLTLTGEFTGDFLALNTKTGAVLYRFPTGGEMGGGIVSYQQQNTQYIAAITGYLINVSGAAEDSGGRMDRGGTPTLIIFSLGGDEVK